MQSLFLSASQDVKKNCRLSTRERITIAILCYLCPKYYRFLGIGLEVMVNGQKFRSLFLVNEIVTTYLGLLYN